MITALKITLSLEFESYATLSNIHEIASELEDVALGFTCVSTARSEQVSFEPIRTDVRTDK